ncbi:hypothetical protein H6P81_020129 [Aristolochia fimbriata]|uniref:Cytochrome P450 n=1 Tax=Aristolochia fimbriata TaxID=158543 RepID=A0AAV7DUN9_ARIFI|nr:hypothetical protein H6P81_020129 [Aristolochia fimbriata]
MENMETFLPLLIFFFSLCIILWTRGRKERGVHPSVPPEVPGRWPVMGHLRKLAGFRQPLVRTLADLADKHGPLVTLWIGPPSNSRRKQFGARKGVLHHERPSPRDSPPDRRRQLALNNVMMAVFSKRYSLGTSSSSKDEMEAREFRNLVSEFSLLMGSPIPSDAMPVLEWFDIGGYIKAMMKTMKGLDSLCSIWLEEHRIRRRLSAGKNDTGSDQDFLDMTLSALDESCFHDLDPDTFVKSLSLSVILSGSDTTSITLTWALSLLLNNRFALKKAQEELDTYVGKDRNVTEEDIPNLSYLQAIVKETMRLYPAAPLAVPHEAIEDCNVGGFRIPAGTRVLLNLWKIHRDPSMWTDPLGFKPERFLTTNADTDVRGQHFELIPFGSGRRMCPGISFALKLTHLSLARLLHGFDIQTPSDDQPVDMTETPGLSIAKATSLEVLLVPRLSSDLYGL